MNKLFTRSCRSLSLRCFLWWIWWRIMNPSLSCYPISLFVVPSFSYRVFPFYFHFLFFFLSVLSCCWLRWIDEKFARLDRKPIRGWVGLYYQSWLAFSYWNKTWKSAKESRLKELESRNGWIRNWMKTIITVATSQVSPPKRCVNMEGYIPTHCDSKIVPDENNFGKWYDIIHLPRILFLLFPRRLMNA